MLRKTAERVEGRKKLELAHLDSIFYSIDMIFSHLFHFFILLRFYDLLDVCILFR